MPSVPARTNGRPNARGPQPVHASRPHRQQVDRDLQGERLQEQSGELWRSSRLRRAKLLNNIVEQDHRRVKRLVGPGLGSGGFRTTRRPLAGYEAMAMVRKGQVRSIGGRGVRAQASFVAELLQVAAWFFPGRNPPRPTAIFAT
jgi:transposase, IS6 family